MFKVGQIMKPNRKHKINSKPVITCSSYFIGRLTNKWQTQLSNCCLIIHEMSPPDTSL